MINHNTHNNEHRIIDKYNCENKLLKTIDNFMFGNRGWSTPPLQTSTSPHYCATHRHFYLVRKNITRVPCGHGVKIMLTSIFFLSTWLTLYTMGDGE